MQPGFLQVKMVKEEMDKFFEKKIYYKIESL